jgi:hypothetical protein
MESQSIRTGGTEGACCSGNLVFDGTGGIVRPTPGDAAGKGLIPVGRSLRQLYEEGAVNG